MLLLKSKKGDFTVEAFNDEACELIGCDGSSIRRRQISGWLSKADLAIISEISSRCSLEKKFIQVNVSATINGKTITLHGIHPIKSEKGNVFLLTLRSAVGANEPLTSFPLLHSGHSFYKLLLNSTDVYYQTDIAGNIVDISPSIERFSGFRREELLGKPVQNVYKQKEDREGLVRKLLSEGEAYDYEVILKRKDGSEVFTSVNAQLLKDIKGKPYGVAGSLRDVTDRWRVRAAMERNLAFERVISGVSAHLLNLDEAEMKDGICEALRKVCEFLGMDRAYLYLFADEREEQETVFFEWKRGGYTSAFEFIHTLFKVNGSAEITRLLREGMWYSDSISERTYCPFVPQDYASYPVPTLLLLPLFSGKQLRGVFGVDSTSIEKNLQSDILTLLKTTSEIFSSWIANLLRGEKIRRIKSRLEGLIQNLEVGVFYEDRRKGILHLNEHFTQIFAVDGTDVPGNDMSIESVHELINKNLLNSDTYRRQNEQLIQQKIRLLNREVALIDGRVLEVDYIPLPADAESEAQMWLFRDNTYQKEVETELIVSKFEAEQSAELKEQYLRHLHNELQMPLRGILECSADMLKTLPAKEIADSVQALRYSAELILSLLEDMVEYSTLSGHAVRIAEQEFPVRDAFHGCLAPFKKAAAKRGLLFRAVIDEHVPETLRGDSPRFMQIVTTLVSHALKNTREGKIEIDLSGDHYLKNREILLHVRDTGVIPAQLLPLYLDVFERGAADTDSLRAIGLGMAMVKAIIDAWGGKITISRENGTGSEWRVTLPMRSTDAAAGGTLTEHDADRSLKKVLVVEDSAINAAFMSAVLKKMEYECIIAEDPAEAIARLRDGSFFIIFTDIQMPGMDGFQFASYVRNNLPFPENTIPIIAVTASRVLEIGDKARLAGIDAILTKPFSLNALRNYLSEYSSRRGVSEVVSSNSTPGQTKKTLIDRNYLEEIFGADKKFMRHMIEQFLDTIPAQIETLSALFGQQECNQIYALAHKLKPSFGFIGMQDIQRLLGLVEAAAQTNDLEAAGKHLKMVLDVIPGLTLELEQIRDGLSLHPDNENSGKAEP